MKEPHLLRASGNPRRLIENIRHLLSASTCAALEKELNENIRGLYSLAMTHFRFANRLAKTSWRHRVSRLYYAGYNATRAVRLCYDGHYSRDPKEHKSFDQLPGDFPHSDEYGTRLSLLRDDRNLCDYDHTVTEEDLVDTPKEATAWMKAFLNDVRDYLSGRGVDL